MAVHTLIAFDRPLLGAAIPGAGRMYSETEVAAIRTKAYHEGSDSAREFASQQLVEFRADVQALQEGIFQKLSTVEPEILAQLRDTLPSLTVELARRLLAGFEPSGEQVARLCQETLALIYPERENLELFVSPRDASLLDQLSPDWKSRYPNLKVTADASLATGDCQVRSRFGLTDARRQAKLEALSRELLSA